MKLSSTKHISYILASIFAIGMLTACNDEIECDVPTADEPGIPVSVNIKYQIGDMPQLSRAEMAEGRDKEINSLWIGFYDGNGDLKHEYSGPADQIGQMDQDFKAIKDLKVSTGTYTIVAVANPTGNYGVRLGERGTNTPTDLMQLLSESKTLEQYKNIAVRIDPGSVDTPTGNLVMQGIYLSNDTHDKNATSDFWAEASTKTVVINRSGNASVTLPGAIHFRRLISHVKFNFSYDTNKIQSFDPVSATIHNIPTLSWLAERLDGMPGNAVTNAGDTSGDADAFTSSQRFYNFNKSGNTYSIDWYQMENRRKAVETVTSYAQREKERQNDDGTNTGMYIPLCGNSGTTYEKNNNATFLTFNVRMTLTDKRTVDATYTIHLGYCEGSGNDKYADYNCRRNYKYTYNVKINDVKKIEVEAQRSAESYEHGAEGVITKVDAAFFNADSHFEQYIVQFTSEELSTLKWSMRIYTNQRDFITITDENYSTFDEKYYNWVEFIPNNNNNSDTYCAEYNPNNVIKLTELKDKTGGYFTMFINEYIYEDQATSGHYGDLTPSWKEYVNIPDRTMWLKVEENRSTDGESVLITSKYAVQQKSLQTYYGIAASNPDQSLALEHINESEKVNFKILDHKASDHGGRYQTAEKIKLLDDKGNIQSGLNSPYWGTSLNLNALETGYGVPKISDGVEHPYACLNRNRDLNGNGRIDANEMRWFVPSMNQYIRFVMGAQSLSSPIYDFSDKTLGAYASYYHYFSAEGGTLWAEEYMSTANENNNATYVRCARYLGVDQTTIPSVLPAQPAFEKINGKNKIIFHYGNESLRSKVNGTLTWHYVNSEYNRPYKAFEYKGQSDDIDLTKDNPFDKSGTQMTTKLWFDNINNTNPCDKFNTNGETGWRIPNQVEMAAIMIEDGGSLSQNTYYITATREYFRNQTEQRSMGIDGTRKIAVAVSLPRDVLLRCVRDVEP